MEPFGALLGFGIAIIAGALGWSISQQIADRKRATWVGLAVGVVCFAALSAMSNPIRDKWVRDDCRAQHGDDGGAVAACIRDANEPDPSSADDRYVGP